MIRVVGKMVGRRSVPQVRMGNEPQTVEKLERSVHRGDVDRRRPRPHGGADILRSRVPEFCDRFKHQLTLGREPVPTRSEQRLPRRSGHHSRIGRRLPYPRLVPAATPLISVCVSTRNRAHLLARLVDALEAQDVGPELFEVIIFDDGSTDNTAEAVHALQKSSLLNLVLLHEDIPSGPAAGRNRAWTAARAPIIAFTDDDCLPAAWWLSAGLRAMREPGVIGVGRVLPNPEQSHLLGAFSQSLWVDESVVLWFATANLFYRKSDLAAVGGFDESFPNPAGEDTDLGLRVVDSGARPVFLRHALVYHDVRVLGLRGMLADQKRWAEIPAVVARHPSLRRRGLTAGVFWRESHPRLLVLLAGAALARRDPRWALLGVPWLHYRTCVKPLCEGPRRRWAVLPAAMVLELNEVRHMIAGSFRYRTLVL